MTDIMTIPDTLPIAPFPALGSANYNQEAYDNGTSVPPAIERMREIAAAGYTNAVATAAQAELVRTRANAAAESASAALTDAQRAELARDRAVQAEAVIEQALSDGPVLSVNGKKGQVTLTAADVGATPEASLKARMQAAALSF